MLARLFRSNSAAKDRRRLPRISEERATVIIDEKSYVLNDWNPKGFMVAPFDGSYSVAHDLIWPRATTIVWLDYAWSVVARRLLSRTIARSFGRQVLWAGNRESFRRSFMSRDSILLWGLKTYGSNRRRTPARLAQPESAHLRVVHLRRPSETGRWLSSVGLAMSGRMV